MIPCPNAFSGGTLAYYPETKCLTPEELFAAEPELPETEAGFCKATGSGVFQDSPSVKRLLPSKPIGNKMGVQM
jgi:hypothetical protein